MRCLRLEGRKVQTGGLGWDGTSPPNLLFEMIHYALRCGGGHEFDGWFANSAGFDSQAKAGLLDCPVCADTRISRALMAPRLGAPRAQTTEVAPASDANVPVKAAAAVPAHLRAALQRIRSEVERQCDYVGPRFAAEVRRQAEGETPSARPIYGEATPEEAAALAEDGIDVARIPWVPRADS